MARPLQTRKYPVHYFEILEHLKNFPMVPVSVPGLDKGAMHGLQLNFLSFRNAAVHEGWDQPDHMPTSYPDLNAYTTKQRKQEDGTFTLEIWHMDYIPENMEIQRQLDAQRDRK